MPTFPFCKTVSPETPATFNPPAKVVVAFAFVVDKAPPKVNPPEKYPSPITESLAKGVVVPIPILVEMLLNLEYY
jgi:hypothetical protein